MMPTRDQIEAAIAAECAKWDVPADLMMRQCQAESSFNPCACNKGSDCYGLFQLSWPTARDLKVDRLDWRGNVSGGVRYMEKLLKKYDGDRAKALAAYNYGPANVDRLLKAHDDWRDHLPAETRGYLRKILG